MYESQVHLETTIDQPRERVFDFLTNPYQIPLVLPGLIENTNVPQLPLKVGDEFNYKYQVMGVVLDGTWTVTELDAPSRYSARTTGGGDSEWRYELTENGKGTHVTLDVSYDPPQSVLQRVQQGVLERVTENDGTAYMLNLKTVLELRNE